MNVQYGRRNSIPVKNALLSRQLLPNVPYCLEELETMDSQEAIEQKILRNIVFFSGMDLIL